MTIDAAAAKALELPDFSVDIERGQLKAFANAIGETNPVFTDLDAARAAGHPDLPVPPTYLFSLGLQAPEPFGYLSRLGIDLRHILHGGQQFDYYATLFAGDRTALHEEIVDTYSKRGGALEFLVKQTQFRREQTLVATGTTTIVIRRPQEAAS